MTPTDIEFIIETQQKQILQLSDSLLKLGRLVEQVTTQQGRILDIVDGLMRRVK